MNFTKHRLLFLFHFMVQHNNIQHLRLLEFSMARSLPIGFFASCLHITSILSTCRALILMSPTCAQSRLVFQSPWPMSQRERISHLVYDFDASSIVWSFDTIEMADWFKDGWRRWLKGGHSSTFKWGVAILHINNITPKICRTSRAWLVIRIIKLSTGLQNWKAANC